MVLSNGGIFLVSATSFFLLSCGGGDNSSTPVTPQACSTLDCKTSAYNLLVADIDFSQSDPQATNIQVVAKNNYQDMTHPRVSPDKNWVAYTLYNDTNTNGCAAPDSGYVNTEIRATSLDGSQTKNIIGVTSGELNSNNYWYGNSFEFIYLSGAPGSTKLYRAQTDTAMNVIAGPTEVTTPATIIPFDPQAISNSQLVYGGQYNNSGLVKSIFIQELNPASTPTGLSLGRDSAGTTLYGNDVLENDPKISPSGDYVTFMRRAPNAGITGFGWRIFVVPVASPLTESNISGSLGASLLNNDVLPEWIDNTSLVFSNIDSSVTFNTRTLWTMQRDGSGRKKIILPDGYRYSDVYPFLDATGKQKIIISAEKINGKCVP